MDASDQVSTSGGRNESILPENFQNLLDEVRDCVHRFQDDQSPENFAGIVTALSGFGLSGADLWKKAAAYAKANPVRVGIYAGILFFALKGLTGQTGQGKLSSRVH
jgi:hypothetical protein